MIDCYFGIVLGVFLSVILIFPVIFCFACLLTVEGERVFSSIWLLISLALFSCSIILISQSNRVSSKDEYVVENFDIYMTENHTAYILDDDRLVFVSHLRGGNILPEEHIVQKTIYEAIPGFIYRNKSHSYSIVNKEDLNVE